VSQGLPSKPSREYELLRDLGPVVAVAIVVGDVIGSGIFLKPAGIAADAGSFPLIIGLWVFGGVLCFLGGLCFAELSTMFPHAGGLYVYLREAYGRPIAFLFGWCEVIFSRPATIGALAVAFAGPPLNALQAWLGWRVPTYVEVLLASAVILVLSWVNYIGVRWGGRMQLATTVVKAGFLALVGLLPFLLWPLMDSVDPNNYATTVTPRQATLPMQIGAVLLAVMWAYNGWHGITPLAEEVRDPQRNIPMALLGGILILTVLYVGANIAYHGVLSMPELEAIAKDEQRNAAQEMVGRLLGPMGNSVMAAVIMCSTFGAINSTILQTPRVTFAMGRDRVFFESLGRVHAEYRTPAAAIWLLAAMSILLVALVAIGKWLVQDVVTEERPTELVPKIIAGLKNGTIFNLLTNFVIFSASIFYMLGVLAVIVLRWKLPQIERPYRTWGYPLTPVLFLAVYCWFLFQVYLSNPLEARTGLAAIFTGVPVLIAYRLWIRSRQDKE